jgi:hypothetical protein
MSVAGIQLGEAWPSPIRKVALVLTYVWDARKLSETGEANMWKRNEVQRTLLTFCEKGKQCREAGREPGEEGLQRELIALTWPPGPPDLSYLTSQPARSLVSSFVWNVAAQSLSS